MDHYDELGVAPTASDAEIRSSYLALARRFHPDRLMTAAPADRDVAAQRMARVNAAWSVLSDRSRRAAYDAVRSGSQGGAGTTGATIRDAGTTFDPFDDDGVDFDPSSIDDTPTGAPTMRRGLTFLPAMLAATGFGVALLGFMVGMGGLLSVGLLMLVGSALSFLLLPLVALLQSSRADLDP